MKEEGIIYNILERLQELHDSWWKTAKKWKELSEINPPEECLSTPQEAAMIANYNCANAIKAILDDFSPHFSDTHRAD